LEEMKKQNEYLKLLLMKSSKIVIDKNSIIETANEGLGVKWSRSNYEDGGVTF
ncbi:hypothetical protein LSA78_002844, partial [Listeria innocua]|nr:hypothetical protein [Listeria innocua]HBM4123121.1 hypothetical protein [Listeria innocua]